MRSFSSFRPVTSGSGLEVRSQTFAMWLRANVHNIKKPYDSRTWRTCKPWLSLRACKLEYRNYKNVSLGYMQIGNARLSDKEVRNAISVTALNYEEEFKAACPQGDLACSKRFQQNKPHSLYLKRAPRNLHHLNVMNLRQELEQAGCRS